MKIGLFWVCEPDRWMQHVATVVTSSAVSQEFEVACFSSQEVGQIRKINRSSGIWPYQAINDLADVYGTATCGGMDFALINFGRGLPTDLRLLQQLLASPALQNCILSMRIAEISGVGMQNPPRLPFVDDHFIILNVRRARARKFFQRKLIHASHFSPAGQRHAELASMIEYALGKDELNNHFVAHASRNQYGETAKLNPLPFHLCEATGFLTCYPEFKSSLTDLLERNLLRLLPSQECHPTLRYALKRGYWYFRFEPWLKKIVSAIRQNSHDIGKYEFKKRYDQEPK
jgi:hypothetical protein